MPTYRVVSLDKGGNPTHVDYRNLAALLAVHEQSGVEEDSYTIRLHGQPTLKGLIGPMSDGRAVVRYETPDAFVLLTEQSVKKPAKAGK